jgi:hypothetical protein
MTPDVIRAQPTETVDALLARMTDRRIRHLPVLDGEHLCGLVSIGDLVKHKIGEVEAEAQTLKPTSPPVMRSAGRGCDRMCRLSDKKALALPAAGARYAPSLKRGPGPLRGLGPSPRAHGFGGSTDLQGRKARPKYRAAFPRLRGLPGGSIFLWNGQFPRKFERTG